MKKPDEVVDVSAVPDRSAQKGVRPVTSVFSREEETSNESEVLVAKVGLLLPDDLKTRFREGTAVSASRTGVLHRLRRALSPEVAARPSDTVEQLEGVVSEANSVVNDFMRRMDRAVIMDDTTQRQLEKLIDPTAREKPAAALFTDGVYVETPKRNVNRAYVINQESIWQIIVSGDFRSASDVVVLVNKYPRNGVERGEFQKYPFYNLYLERDGKAWQLCGQECGLGGRDGQFQANRGAGGNWSCELSHGDAKFLGSFDDSFVKTKTRMILSQ